MQIIELLINDLKFAEYNPRVITKEEFEGLKQSLKTFGFVDPAIINKDYTIIGGHQRIRGWKDLGHDTAPCIVLDLNKKQEKKLNIILNSHAISGKYDPLKLDELLEELKLDDDYESLRLIELESIDLSSKEVEEDDFEPPKEAKYKVELGDVFQLGNHRLMCGDSTKIEDVEKLMDGHKADMVFTDPPYGVEYTGGHNKKKRQGIENDELQGTDLTQLFHDSIANAVVVSKDYSAFYIWYASGKSVETFASFSGLGLDLRAVIQWYKVHSGLGAFMSQYIPNCEPCIYAFKTGYSPQWFGASDEKTVWELKREGKSEYHPTQKPIELCARAIKNSSKSDDIVLDLFGGSGSTLIACEQLNRKCYMMELDPYYVSVIIERWEKLTGKQHQKVNILVEDQQ